MVRVAQYSLSVFLKDLSPCFRGEVELKKNKKKKYSARVSNSQYYRVTESKDDQTAYTTHDLLRSRDCFQGLGMDQKVK